MFKSREKLAAVVAGTVLLLAALPCLFVHLHCELLPEDDAFITYRYVDNIVAGRGPVYNAGVRVFGTTTPLYVGWLVILKSCTGLATPFLAVRLNLFHYLLSGIFLFTAARRIVMSTAAALVCSIFFLLQPEMLKISLGGMEPFFLLWLVLASLTLALAGRPVPACAVMGVATLVRPEGGVFLPALLPLMDWTKRRQISFCALACAVPLLLWIVPAWLYFGTPIPQSVTAKLAPLYPVQPGHMLISILGEMELWLTRGRLVNAPITGLGLIAVLAIFHVALLGLLGSGAADAGPWATPHNRRAGLSVFLLLALPVTFYALTNPLFCSWYLPQLFAPLALFLLAGASGIFALARAKAANCRSPAGRRTLTGAAIAAPLLLAIWMIWSTAVSWSDTCYKSRGRPASLGRQCDNAVLRIKAYRQAAEWLNLSAPAAARILSAEVGALGYYYDGFVIDACGLVSPEATRYLPVPAEQRIASEASAIRNELVEDLLPDYVVSMWAFSTESIDRSAWFKANYRPARSFPLEIHPPDKDLWGGTEVVVHQRR